MYDYTLNVLPTRTKGERTFSPGIHLASRGWVPMNIPLGLGAEELHPSTMILCLLFPATRII